VSAPFFGSHVGSGGPAPRSIGGNAASLALRTPHGKSQYWTYQAQGASDVKSHMNETAGGFQHAQGATSKPSLAPWRH